MAALSYAALLLVCFTTAADFQPSCDKYALIGDPYVVPLDHKLQPTEMLTWKYNQGKIFRRKGKEQPIVGAEGDVTEDGSLKLKKAEVKNAGLYSPEVYDNSGKKLNVGKSYYLCVLARVSKPNVKVECQENKVKFTCNTTEKEIVWLQNERPMENKKSSSLMLTKDEAKEGSFSCRASNPASVSTSDPATASCPEDGLLLGVEFWVMVYILSAGGGFVLLLIVIIIICCVCARRKKKMQVKDEEEFRLTWANTEQQKQAKNAPSRQHHPRVYKNQQQAAGNTGPRPHTSVKQNKPQSKNSGPQAKPRNHAKRPAQLDEERPPPLPQPRKQGVRS